MKKFFLITLLFGIIGCASTGSQYIAKDIKKYKKSHEQIYTPRGSWELSSSYEELLYPKVKATNIKTGKSTFLNFRSGYSFDCPIFTDTCLSTDPNDNGGVGWSFFDIESVKAREIFVFGDEETEKVNNKIKQFLNSKRAKEIVVDSCEEIYGSKCYLSMINDKKVEFYESQQSKFNIAYKEYNNESSKEYPVCDGMYNPNAGKGFLEYWDNCWGTAYVNGNEISSIFIKNKASKYALVTYSDGSTYAGEVRNNFAHGYGKVTDKDGNIRKGDMLYGDMHGRGLCIIDGKNYICNYDNGKFISTNNLVTKNSYTNKSNSKESKQIEYSEKQSSNKTENRFGSFLAEILVGAMSEVLEQKIINEFVEPCIPKVETSAKSSQVIPGAPQYGTKIRTKVTVTGCPQY